MQRELCHQKFTPGWKKTHGYRNSAVHCVTSVQINRAESFLSLAVLTTYTNLRLGVLVNMLSLGDFMSLVSCLLPGSTEPPFITSCPSMNFFSGQNVLTPEEIVILHPYKIKINILDPQMSQFTLKPADIYKTFKGKHYSSRKREHQVVSRQKKRNKGHEKPWRTQETNKNSIILYMIRLRRNEK